MNSANAYWMQVIAPAAAASSVVNGNVIDTAGFDYLELIASQGAQAAGLTALILALQEGDSSSTFSGSITGANVGTSTPLFAAAGAGSNLPSTATNNTLQVFNVDLKGRKRYLNLTLTPSSSSGLFLDAIARLTRAERSPESAASSGANQVFQLPPAST